MRIGWLVDQGNYVGGAELTEREFRAAAPEGVEIIDCRPGQIADADRYVVHNCVSYTPDDFKRIGRKHVYKYWNDVGSWLDPEVRAWLDKRATPICCSPLQQDYMGYTQALLIPPPIDLHRFIEAGARSNGNRKGAVSVGSWRNLGKAAHHAAEWAKGTDGIAGIDFYGSGAFAPEGSRQIAYEGMPALLAGYETFVYLPMVIEPFGRVVAEAWAAGCEIVTNDLVGARYWIESKPDAIDTAATDFWTAVLP